MRFLTSLDIPLIATFRDSQNYVRTAESGLGVFELPSWRVRDDVEEWDALMSWLANKRASSNNLEADIPIRRKSV